MGCSDHHSCALAFGACLAANFRADFRPLLALLLPPAAPGASIYHAMDAVATDEEAAFLAQLLAGGVEDRQAAYTQLQSSPAAATAAIADALVNSVLCSGALDTAEYQQVCSLMGELMLRDKHGFSMHYIRESRWMKAWDSPQFIAAMSQSAAELTREDVILASGEALLFLMILSRGWTESFEVARLSELECLTWIVAHPLMTSPTPKFAKNPGVDMRRVLTALAICRDNQQGGLSDMQLAGVWTYLVRMSYA